MDRVHIALGFLILLGVALGLGGDWLSPVPSRAAARDAPRIAPAPPAQFDPPQIPPPAAAAEQAVPRTTPSPPAPAPAPAPAPTLPAATLVGEAAVVDNTEGLGLLLRTAPDLNAEFVASLLDGAGVEVLETSMVYDTRWYLVRFGDLRGWVRAQFLRRP